MSRKTISHHYISKFLEDFSGTNTDSNRKRSLSGAKAAQAHFASVGYDSKANVVRAAIPFSQIPDDRYPAVYFTRTGQHPVIVQENTPMGYSIQLWDGRESLCDRRRLEKTLEPVGYFLSEAGPEIKQKARKNLFAELLDERRAIALGLANGAITCALLIVFVFVLHRVFQSAFPITEINSIGFAIVGMIAAVLSCLGFLQARYFIGIHFDKLLKTHRAREMKMPPPFPVQTLTSHSSVRSMMEAAFAPFFLAAAALILGYDWTSIASWSAICACVIPAFIFLAKLPGLLDKWTQALWFFEEKEQPAALVKNSPVQCESLPDPRHETEIDNSMVRVHNLFLAHPQESEAPLIDHVSLKIAKSEKVGFLGSHKGDVPVFLRVVSGLLSSDRGLVWIDGKMISSDQSNLIGWFSERASLIDGTVRENICMGRNFSTTAIEAAARFTGLTESAIYAEQGLDAPIQETAGGWAEIDKIRLLLTRSLIHRPEVLVFDSPKGQSHHNVFREILEDYLADNDCTLLLGGKQIDQLDLTERTIVLKNGKIAKDVTTESLIKAPQKQPATKP